MVSHSLGTGIAILYRKWWQTQYLHEQKINGSVGSLSSIHWSNMSIQTWSYPPQPTERYFAGEQIYNLFHSFQDEAATNYIIVYLRLFWRVIVTSVERS